MFNFKKSLLTLSIYFLFETYLLIIPKGLEAVDYTWASNNNNANWNINANWTPNTGFPNNANDKAIFPDVTGNANKSVSLQQAITIGSLSFTTTTKNYTIDSGTPATSALTFSGTSTVQISITGGGVTNGAHTISSPVVLNTGTNSTIINHTNT